MSTGGDIEILRCRIHSNSSTASGGGIYNSSRWLELNQCTIENNSSSGSASSGIYAEERIQITGCNISDEIQLSRGGEIVEDTISAELSSAYPGLKVDIRHSQFEEAGISYFTEIDTGAVIVGCSFNNTPDRALELMAFSDGKYVVDSCTVSNCTGGAIRLNTDASLNISSTDLINNFSPTGAGILQSAHVSSPHSIVNCRFIGNTSEQGGAIYVGGYANIDITDCLFSGNQADSGGALYLVDIYNVDVTNCTFESNDALRGSAVYAGTFESTSPDINLEYTVLFNNYGGSVVQWPETPDFNSNVICSDVYGNGGGDWTGSLADFEGINGNISSNPIFCGVPNGDFTITSNSPCAPENNDCYDLIGAYEVGCTGLEIVSIRPEQNELNVPSGELIVMEFSEEMDLSSFNESTFQVFGSISGKNSGSMNWYFDNTTLVFSPDGEFFAGEVVTVTLTGDVTSLSGTPLGQGFQWRFTVEVLGGVAQFIVDSVYSLDFELEQTLSADLNSDGCSDLICCTDDPDSLCVLINDGYGTLQDPVTYELSNGHSPIACDIDGEGSQDIVVISGSGVVVFLNNGNGTFGTAYGISGEHTSDPLCAGDIDNDGDIDILCSGKIGWQGGEDTLLVFENNGGGLFEITDTVFTSARHTWRMGLADVDNDGFSDLLVSTLDPILLTTFRNSQNGHFIWQEDYSIPCEARNMCTADLDADGWIDIILGHWDYCGFTVLTNNQSGNFSSQHNYDYHDISIADQVLTGDIDNDDDLDIVIAEDYYWKKPDLNSISYSLNDGYGNFPQNEKLNIEGGQLGGLLLLDLEHDGDLDLALTSYYTGAIHILKNDHTLSVTPSHLGFYHELEGDLPAPDTIFIESDSPIPQPWSLEKAGPWLSVSDTSGMTPDTIEVSVDTTGLVSRLYTGLITVSSAGANNSPQDVELSLHVDPSVEVGDEYTPPGSSDSLPIYISHNDIAGLFVPLTYAGGDSVKASPITVDSVIVNGYYQSYDVDAFIDVIHEEVVLTSPVKDPPIPKPDTVGTDELCMLAMIYYTVDPLAEDQVLIIDTTTSETCPVWDTSGACGIQYLLPDGSIDIPNFEPGQIEIGEVSDGTVIGFIDTDPDTVKYVNDGSDPLEKSIAVMHTGTEQHPFAASVTGDLFTVDINTGVTPTDITITRVGIPSGTMNTEILTITSELTGYQKDVTLRYNHHLCGDVMTSGFVDIDDIVYLIGYIYQEGPAPDPLWVADIDCDGLINLLDITLMINYIFRGGPEPCFLCD